MTLDDAEIRGLPDHEVDTLIALNLFQAIIDRPELAASVPPTLLRLQEHIASTKAIVDDEFQAWLHGAADRSAMFTDVVASVRAQWVASQEEARAKRAEDAIISRVEEGASLTIYLPNGKKKHDRYFTASAERVALSWRKTGKMVSNTGKTMTLVGCEGTIQTKSAEEWFATIDVDGDGVLDSSQLSTLYLRARGESLSTKQLKASMATIDTDGSGGVGFDEFVHWWAEKCGDLEKHKELAFTVSLQQPSDLGGGPYQLLIVAPDDHTKEAWVSGLSAILARAERLAAKEKEAALRKAEKRLTRSQVRLKVRLQLQAEGRDPNVSNAWIDQIFDEYDADQSGVIEDTEWEKLKAHLDDDGRKPLNRAQVHKMVRVQLQLDGKAEASSQQLDKLFDQFDSDGSGMMEESEWDKLCLELDKRCTWLM
jgi:Ca2+-binding EF-hand superfamily protein